MPDHSVSHVAVLGAGTMGHGIAHAALAAGVSVTIHDLSNDALQRGSAAIERLFAKGVELGKIEAASATDALGRLEVFPDIEDAVRNADLVIEAVPERMELKLEVLGRAERAAPSHAYLASNTSALSLTEMACALTRPERFAGMHFFNPVHRMKLVEVVRALDTAPETVALLESVARQLGKEPVVVRESPGFVTSRINVLIGNEAFYMLHEGVASAADIDKALKLGLNHPMGPFELGDLVGLDTRLSVLRYLHRTLGEKYRPSPLLVQYVEAGRLGRKTGRGVFDYRS